MKSLNFILFLAFFNILFLNAQLTDQQISLLQDFVSYLSYDQNSNTFSLQQTNFKVQNFLANGITNLNLSSLAPIQIGNQFTSGIQLSASDSIAQGIALLGNVYTSGNCKIDGVLEARGNMVLEGTLYGSTIEGNSGTFDVLDVSTQCNIPGQTNLSGQINISGTTTFTGTTNVNSGTVNFNVNPRFLNVSGTGAFLSLNQNNQLILTNGPDVSTLNNVNIQGYLNVEGDVSLRGLSTLSLNDQPSTKLLFLNTDKEIVSFSPFTQQNNILTRSDLNTIGADGVNAGQIYSAICESGNIKTKLDETYGTSSGSIEKHTAFGTDAESTVNVGKSNQSLILNGTNFSVNNTGDVSLRGKINAQYLDPVGVDAISVPNIIVQNTNFDLQVMPWVRVRDSITQNSFTFGTTATSPITVGNKSIANLNLNLDSGLDSSINVAYRETNTPGVVSNNGIFFKYENTQAQKSINVLQLKALADERNNLVSYIIFGGSSNPDDTCSYRFSNLEGRNPSGFYPLYVDSNGVLYRDLTTRSYNLNENKNYSITISEKHIECINNFLKKTFSKDNNSTEQKNNNNHLENLIDIIQQQDKEIELLQQNYNEEIKNLKKENKSIIKKLNKLIDTLKKLNVGGEENQLDELKYKDLD